MADRVFTIAPSEPFLDRLAAAVLDGTLPNGGAAPDPLALAGLTILLPNRRSARAMQEAFLRAETARRGGLGAGVALLLPAIRPIAEAPDDLSLIAALAYDSASLTTLDVPPAVGEIERRLTLTSLVVAWSRAMRERDAADGTAPVASAGAETPAQALRLAAELARLMDMLETEGVSIQRLATLVPDDYSAHWQNTLAFLEIATGFWPAHLAERGLISPAERRNRILDAEAERIANEPSGAGIIAAGVTGTIPATVRVMRAVHQRTDGAIVLPGVDLDLDPESFAQIRPDHPEHPQFALSGLLAKLGVERADVRPLGGDRKRRGAARGRLVSETMRPASTTERWRGYVADLSPDAGSDALSGLSLIEAQSEREEAEVVALILREAVEVPGRTAALVSPDRRLARRVAARLSGLGIEVDDSAGRPFAKTETGSLLDLTVTAIDTQFAPAHVLALLKHPLTRLGLSARERGFQTRALELAAFRTLYLARGLDGIRTQLDAAEAAIAHPAERLPLAVRRLRAEDWQRARDLVDRLTRAFEPLSELYAAREPVPLARFVAAHAEVATALAERPPDETGSGLWSGADGEAGAVLLAGLAEPGPSALTLLSADYAEFYRGLVATETVRPSQPMHPRVSIWGPFEARLQRPDVVVLGSLNEGTWPEAADPGPWLNRPMRLELGLPSPEERLGAAAHDVTMLLGADRVVLTRALKVDNTPKVASRWLLRLTALLDSAGLRDRLEADTPWLAWARSRDLPAGPRQRPRPPAPRPAYALRPRRMSVSDVGTWIANPYAIHARRILKLEALPPVGRVPDAALRGTILHQALAEFTDAHPTKLPADPASDLLDIVRRVLGSYTGDPRVAAFWVPRLERFCRWFATEESARRARVSRTVGEVTGLLSISGLREPFVLTARADRADVTPDGLVLYDYKTGAPPSGERVARGFAPQLPLEAAIAERVGLGQLRPGPVARLVYVRATGGEPPGKEYDVAKGEVSAVAQRTLDELERLILRYDDPTEPYPAVRRPGFQYAFDDYAHLARVAEWLAADLDAAAPDAASAEARVSHGAPGQEEDAA